jgi:hypothetical protein
MSMIILVEELVAVVHHDLREKGDKLIDKNEASHFIEHPAGGVIQGRRGRCCGQVTGARISPLSAAVKAATMTSVAAAPTMASSRLEAVVNYARKPAMEGWQWGRT